MRTSPRRASAGRWLLRLRRAALSFAGMSAAATIAACPLTPPTRNSPISGLGLNMSARYNSGYNGKFNRYGDPIRDKAKQEWAIGNVVNVGFLKGLKVMDKRSTGEFVLLSQTGKKYHFQPHFGIYAV